MLLLPTIIGEHSRRIEVDRAGTSHDHAPRRRARCVRGMTQKLDIQPPLILTDRQVSRNAYSV
jgi:hypothetical protein